MTVLILDRGEAPLPPYLEWLADGQADTVLFTGRTRAELDDHDTSGYAEIRCFADYDTSTRVERDAVRLAESTPIRGVIALAPEDAIRTGALRDLLGVDGQGRDDAIASRDLVASRDRLERAGVPTLRCGAVARISDLYWYGDAWGYPVLVRRRRVPGWPIVADLRAESDVVAFTRGGLSPKLEAVPSLVAEPSVSPDRPRVVVSWREDGSWRAPSGCPAPAAAVAEAAVLRQAASLGSGWSVELAATAEEGWCIDTIGPGGGGQLRNRVRAQAGLGEDSSRARR